MFKGYKINSEIKSDFPFKLYKATHLSSEKSVLIKFLKLDSPEQFENELQSNLNAVSQINHPNLARIFEFGKIDDTEIYIVSEEISGQSLREFLEIKSPLLERHAIKIARQIAEGLEVLHENDVIHRAVNPSNIYFANAENTDFSVKLQNYDFGGIEQKAVVRGAIGIDAKTEIFRFFSPEQFTGETLDFKSDLYSLAVVFYEMLLGRSPYDFLSPQAISKYVFDENDVDKLHFDLRALLAYTLKQSLQHRLNLRPPTTNNLARQYRHLELIATPPTIGLQEKQANRNKPKRIINVPQPEKSFVAEEKIAKPEIIETEISAAENIIPAPKFAEKVLTEENNIPTPTFIEETPATENIIPMPEFVEDIPATEENFDLQNIETDLKEAEVFEAPAETKPEIAAAKFVEIEESKNQISEEINIFDEQKSVHKFINFDTTDLTEFEMAFDNIHITNKDDEDPETSLSEIFEYEDSEFVEEELNAKPARERQAMNSFISYAAPRSSAFKKSYVYIAGAIVLFLFSGLIAVSLWQSQSDKTSAQTPPQKVVKPEKVEKKEVVVVPETIKETAEITDEPPALPQYDGRQNEEILQTDEMPVKIRSNKIPQNQPVLKTENKPVPAIKEKSADVAAENKSVKESPVKKQEKPKTQSIQDIRTTTVIVVGKTKPTVKKTDGTNRPRIVTTSPSGN